jgi:hypothetical protein
MKKKRTEQVHTCNPRTVSMRQENLKFQARFLFEILLRERERKGEREKERERERERERENSVY